MPRYYGATSIEVYTKYAALPFFKINTWGEEAFLDALRGIVVEFGR